MLQPPVQEEPAAEEAETPAESGQDSMGPYGIPLYKSAEEVDLATVFEGHSKKRLVDLFGSLEIACEYDQFNSSNTLVHSYISDQQYYLDNRYWEEPQYVKYIKNQLKYSAFDNIQIGDKFLIYNSDLYNGNPYEMCLADSGYVLRRDPVNNLEEQLVNSFLFSSEKYTFNVTKTEKTEGMYLIHFDVLDRNTGDFVEYNNCYVLIDPKTSLIYKTSYQYDSMYKDTPTITELTREVHYGMTDLPTYGSYFSEIS